MSTPGPRIGGREPQTSGMIGNPSYKVRKFKMRLLNSTLRHGLLKLIHFVPLGVVASLVLALATPAHGQSVQQLSP